jgi:hypothetical protein
MIAVAFPTSSHTQRRVRYFRYWQHFSDMAQPHHYDQPDGAPPPRETICKSAKLKRGHLSG